jgi:hypothetical protein
VGVRRLALFLASMAVMVSVAAGFAFAALLTGTNNND